MRGRESDVEVLWPKGLGKNLTHRKDPLRGVKEGVGASVLINDLATPATRQDDFAVAVAAGRGNQAATSGAN